MKKIPFVLAILCTFILEVFLCFLYLGKIEGSVQDPVLVNECLHSVEDNFGNSAAYSRALDYVIVNTDWEVIFKTREGLHESRNEAIKNNDLMLDIEVKNNDLMPDLAVKGSVLGKIIIYNDTAEKIKSFRQSIITGMIFIFAVQLLLILTYFLYLKKSIITPFKKMNAFAVRVAGGNLDLPLELDKKHVFGSFTEAFDLMRNELKKAKIAEKKANDEKKEVIAKLSHDIKTPVASIKSTSEFGYELTREDRTKEMFNLINVKSDQITTLVDNLFNSSVNDVTEIEVNSYTYSSEILEEIIRNADYLHKIQADSLHIPKCSIFCDKLRLQQTFDNIIMNSYKYASTDIEVETKLEEDYLVIRIKDFGPGVKSEELPLLKNKYKRGSNIEGRDGAGLGLYLSDYFMNRMNGKLDIENVYTTMDGKLDNEIVHTSMNGGKKISGFAVNISLRTN